MENGDDTGGLQGWKYGLPATPGQSCVNGSMDVAIGHLIAEESRKRWDKQDDPFPSFILSVNRRTWATPVRAVSINVSGI